MERILEVNRSPEGEIVIRLCAPRRLPVEARRHLMGTTKEGLLTLRSLLDAALRRLETEEQQVGKKKKGPTKIEVQ
ncbi:MAG: hypothetical protein QGH23_09040 [Dehalococcoidia bacterium]|nr:hypothetical protein [Dehalococcoidia bacterium]MDP6511337.1 hypothetical protein [Dehalococcoidia bacterium]MDP6783641.1 hypothetical protein [Dehalococcoidia bacterium]